MNNIFLTINQIYKAKYVCYISEIAYLFFISTPYGKHCHLGKNSFSLATEEKQCISSMCLQ